MSKRAIFIRMSEREHAMIAKQAESLNTSINSLVMNKLFGKRIEQNPRGAKPRVDASCKEPAQ